MSDDKTQVVEEKSDASTTNPNRSSPVLLQYDGGAAGKKFILTTKTVIVGRRAEKVQVWIDDTSVSREHCRLDFDGNRATVSDLGSLNHTYINDRQVLQTSELCHGDMLRVGNVRLRYYTRGSADQLLFDRIYRMAVQERMLEIFRRDYLMERFDEEFRIAKQNNTPLCLLEFDLDRFKIVNDMYGHDAGDLVLKEVCKQVKEILAPNFVFGRYGGEEFCIVLPQTSLEAGKHFGEKIRAKIQEHQIEYEGTPLKVTVSVGVAALKAGINTPADLFKLADSLLYHSKHSGRNLVTCG